MVFTVLPKSGDVVVEEIKPICAEDDNEGAADELDADEDLVDCKVSVASEASTPIGLVLNVSCDTD